MSYTCQTNPNKESMWEQKIEITQGGLVEAWGTIRVRRGKWTAVEDQREPIEEKVGSLKAAIRRKWNVPITGRVK